MSDGHSSQLTDELVYFRSTGEPFGWSKIPTTELLLDMTDSSNMQSVVLADASKVQPPKPRTLDSRSYLDSQV